MIELDARVVALAALAGIATAAAPVALGRWPLVVGLVAGVLATRSVLRDEEGDVTTAIVVGGLAVLVALGRGHPAAIATCAGVFAGAEIAALARRLGVDHDAPAGPEVAATATTIAVGLAAGAVVAAVAVVRASATVANIALVVVILLGLVLLAVRAWGSRDPGASPQR